MSKIYGDDKVIARAKAAKAGNTSVLINWEAIKDMPDQYEIVVNSVKFDPNSLDEFFTNVGTKKMPKWYPHIELMYRIAEARGVNGSNAIIEPIYEDVEIDEMNMTETGRILHKKVGYMVKKSASVLQEDGTPWSPGERIAIENAWDTCVKAWHKEEEATEDYTKVKAYPSGDKYYETTWNGKASKHNCKYNTKWARRKSFEEELDKSAGKADSKAKSKAIRETAGMQTGFLTEDLLSGEIIVSKVRRSRQILQAESAARLSAMSQGIEQKQAPQEIVADLFGTPEQQPVLTPVASLVEQATDTPKWQQLLDALDTYSSGGFVPPASMATVTGIIGWLDTKRANAETDPTYWDKAIGILHDVESVLADSDKVKHSL